MQGTEHDHYHKMKTVLLRKVGLQAFRKLWSEHTYVSSNYKQTYVQSDCLFVCLFVCFQSAATNRVEYTEMLTFCVVI